MVQFSGTNKSKSITLTPIVYGITILTNAPHQQLATEFMQLLLGPQGVQITKDNFIDPISPAEATIRLNKYSKCNPKIRCNALREIIYHLIFYYFEMKLLGCIK